MSASEPLLRVRDLRVSFPGRRAGLKRGAPIVAVDGVDLDVQPGETVALVGESGSGKTTTIRAVLGLIPRQAGEILLDGVDIGQLSPRAMRPHRRHVSMVFQDPYASLDPRVSIGDSIREPLRVHTEIGKKEQERRVGEVLEQVGLRAADASRYPREFSGGQRQRIAIARAIVLRPKLVVLDEPVSSLDVTVQNQVVKLLEQLQRDEGMAYVFVTHDLTVTRRLATRVAVMYCGRIVEFGAAADVLDRPEHPYTRALMDAVPIPDPVVQKARSRIRLRAEPADPAHRPSGCSFHPRCVEAVEQCPSIDPPSRQSKRTGAWAACLLVEPVEGSSAPYVDAPQRRALAAPDAEPDGQRPLAEALPASVPIRPH